MPKDWTLPKEWGDWALAERDDLDRDAVLNIANEFKDHWLANANQANAKKSDWLAAWRNWVRRQKTFKSSKHSQNTKEGARTVVANSVFLGLRMYSPSI